MVIPNEFFYPISFNQWLLLIFYEECFKKYKILQPSITAYLQPSYVFKYILQLLILAILGTTLHKAFLQFNFIFKVNQVKLFQNEDINEELLIMVNESTDVDYMVVHGTSYAACR